MGCGVRNQDSQLEKLGQAEAGAYIVSQIAKGFS